MESKTLSVSSPALKSVANFYKRLLKDIEPTDNGKELKKLVEEANENQATEETCPKPDKKSTLAYKIYSRLLKDHINFQKSRQVIHRVETVKHQFRRPQLAPDFSISSKSVRLLRASYTVLKQ